MFGRHKVDEMQIKEYLEKQDAKIAEVEAKNKKLEEENDRLYNEKNKIDEENIKIGALAHKWMDESIKCKEDKKYWKNQAMLYQEKLVNLNEPVDKSKKYKRQIRVAQMCGGLVTDETWNKMLQELKEVIANDIGDKPIEQIVSTQVDGGVQYLIIYKEEVKE